MSSQENNLKQSLLEFVRSFLSDKGRTVDASKDYYQLIKDEIPTVIKNHLNNDYLVVGSAGRGNKTTYPWICIFNKAITKSAQRGLYIAILFRSDLSGFYISLNQGITNFKEKFKSKRHYYAEEVAKYFRSQITSQTFRLYSINLLSKKSDLGYSYERANIFAKYYEMNKLASYSLFDDLTEMSTIYDTIYENMRPYSYDDIIDSVVNNEDSDLVMSDMADQIMAEALLESADEDQVGIMTLEEVELPTASPRSFTKIRRGIVKKQDYIKKAIEDTKTGLFGERLVLAFERDRLKNLGLDDYVSKIRWVSKESDSYGYDLESYDLINDKVVKRYIEVKTTKQAKQSEFFISRNEVNFSKENKSNYWLYRVFDLESDSPKVFCTKGDVEESFSLEPYTYIAKVKWL